MSEFEDGLARLDASIDRSDAIWTHNETLGRAGVMVGEACALAAGRALSRPDRETIELAGQLLVRLIRSQRLAWPGPGPVCPHCHDDPPASQCPRCGRRPTDRTGPASDPG